MTDPEILVVAVAYESPEESLALAESFLAAGAAGVELVIADNSPSPSERLTRLAADESALEIMHFPDNPNYSGAGRRVIDELMGERGPLRHRAVVLCNVDLEVPWGDLVETVDAARAHTGDLRWILAPDTIEPGRRWRANPFALEPQRTRRRHLLMRRSRWFFQTYWGLSLLRRRFFENPHVDLAPWSPTYAPYGSFIVFGADWFRSGGVLHHGPLFNEEEAFGSMSAHIGAPVLWAPMLRIVHHSGVSYRGRRGVGRRRHAWHVAAEEFYDDWRPADVSGSMTGAFRERT